MDKMGLIRCWATLTLIPLILIYLVVPALIYFLPRLTHHVFFLNFVKLPFTDYTNLSSHGVHSLGRNFYLRQNDDVTLGAWHILPESLSRQYADDIRPSEKVIEGSLGTGHFPIVVYLHGNSFDRTGDHRCKLYNVLSKMDMHVIAVDYRGYGDSTGSPDEAGIVEDAKRTYLYARKLAPTAPIYIWGHSMGTGVAAKAVQDLSEMGMAPEGLILESPFNNLRDVVLNHPMSLPYRWIPWFDSIYIHPMREGGLDMSSDERITKVACPILILHANDDHIIPTALGRKLKVAAEMALRDVTMVEFEANRKFRHKHIWKAEELPEILRRFTKRCESRKID